MKCFLSIDSPPADKIPLKISFQPANCQPTTCGTAGVPPQVLHLPSIRVFSLRTTLNFYIPHSKNPHIIRNITIPRNITTLHDTTAVTVGYPMVWPLGPPYNEFPWFTCHMRLNSDSSDDSQIKCDDLQIWTLPESNWIGVMMDLLMVTVDRFSICIWADESELRNQKNKNSNNNCHHVTYCSKFHEGTCVQRTLERREEENHGEHYRENKILSHRNITA